MLKQDKNKPPKSVEHLANIIKKNNLKLKKFQLNDIIFGLKKYVWTNTMKITIIRFYINFKLIKLFYIKIKNK